MVLADARGLPLAIDIEVAYHAEVNLIEPLLDSAATTYVPDRLIYDKATDRDPLRERLAKRVPTTPAFTTSVFNNLASSSG